MVSVGSSCWVEVVLARMRVFLVECLGIFRGSSHFS